MLTRYSSLGSCGIIINVSVTVISKKLKKIHSGSCFPVQWNGLVGCPGWWTVRSSFGWMVHWCLYCSNAPYWVRLWVHNRLYPTPVARDFQRKAACFCRLRSARGNGCSLFVSFCAKWAPPFLLLEAWVLPRGKAVGTALRFTRSD